MPSNSWAGCVSDTEHESTPSGTSVDASHGNLGPHAGPHVGAHARPTGGRLVALSVGALGVVYGDIGTSVLYALKECFHRVEPTHDNVLGILSLVIWSLLLVVTVKYIIFVLRADNRGEGGILALLALASTRQDGGDDARSRRKHLFLAAIGLVGAALLYGDGMITPAISVLSAVEGLEVATPALRPFVIPITVGILIALFLPQSRGTASVGKVFGPIMLLWFGILAVLGVHWMLKAPEVLGSINPMFGVRFFADNGWTGFLVLGSVFLVVTGGEALYADMGHFGKRPIRLAWLLVVLPALLLNYFGQGAVLLLEPESRENPLYHMVPEWGLYPMVALAAAATVIASQALISGAFSLTRQAVQLGYSPRMLIRHTSRSEIGQIYVPAVNWALMAGCVGLVLGFRTSSNLAAAYGIAVTGTMAATTVLFYVVMRERFGWSVLAAGAPALAFLTIDFAFFGANIVKIADGGWFPLLVAALLYALMATWKTGERLLAERLRDASPNTSDFLERLRREEIVRVPGSAVFMTQCVDDVPPRLAQYLRHTKVLHEEILLLHIQVDEVSHFDEGYDRFTVRTVGAGITRAIVKFGFMEQPDVPPIMQRLREFGLRLTPDDTTYFLGRETVLSTDRPGMAPWRERLFAVLARNEVTATRYFRIPPNQVVELGIQVDI